MGLRVWILLFTVAIAACGKTGDEGSGADSNVQAATIEPVAIENEIPPAPPAPVRAQPSEQGPTEKRSAEPTPVFAEAPIFVSRAKPRAQVEEEPARYAEAPPAETPKKSEPVPLPKPRPEIKTETKRAPKEDLSALEAELLRLLNSARAKRGLAPLKFSRLQSSGSRTCIGSQGHSQHMAATRRMSHDQFPADICLRAGASAENVGYATGDAIRAVHAVHKLMMDEGPGGGHYDNIMNPTYNTVGLGFYYTRDRVLWVTENFLRL